MGAEKSLKKPIYKRWWFIVIFIPALVALYSVSQNSKRHEEDARKRGFDNYDQYISALAVNCDTKECYLQSLKDKKIKEQQENAAAEKAKADSAAELARRNAEKSAASQESPVSSEDKNSNSTRQNTVSDPVLADGNRLSQWKKMCSFYSRVKYECASASDPGSCEDTRLGDLALNRSIYDCEGGNPPYYLLPKN